MKVFFHCTIYNNKNYKSDYIMIPKTGDAQNIDQAISLVSKTLKKDEYIAVVRELHENGKRIIE
jgi:phage terminase large subunit-like protein